LTHERILWFRQDAHQGALVQIAQNADDGEPTHKLRDQAVTDQISRLRLFQNFNVAPSGRRRLRVGMEAEGLLSYSPFNQFLKPHKGSAADEQNIRRVDRREFLVRMLAPALGGNVGDRTFENLEQRL